MPVMKRSSSFLFSVRANLRQSEKVDGKCLKKKKSDLPIAICGPFLRISLQASVCEAGRGEWLKILEMFLGVSQQPHLCSPQTLVKELGL